MEIIKCDTCGHDIHKKTCRVLMNKGTIHETICGCNYELKPPSNKQYIGDGVYIEYDNYSVILTTENGLYTTNKIVLEAEVLNSLNEYLKEMFKAGRLGESHDKPK